MMYQPVHLADHTLLGEPGPVPDRLIGLSDAQLSDLSAFSDPAPDGYAGMGLWPLVVTAPSYDPATQALGPVDPASLAADAAARVVHGTASLRALTAEEIEARKPPPYAIYKTDVISRMTDPELDQFDAALASATTRERRMWTDCIRIESDSPYFAGLTAEFAQAFGADRAKILLAPSA